MLRKSLLKDLLIVFMFLKRVTDYVSSLFNNKIMTDFLFGG